MYSEIEDGRIPRVLIGLGLLLGAILAGQSFAIAFLTFPLTAAFIVVVATSVPCILVLILGGFKLTRSVMSTHRHYRVLQWSLSGLLVFTGVNLGLMTTIPVSGLFGAVGWVQWAASLGAGAGFLIGYFEASALEREAESQQAAVRSEELAERRELLTYLNGLLRHEVLNSANVIAGYASQIEETAGEGGPSAEYARIVRSEADELSRVTKDVRLLLEATDGGKTLEPVPLSAVLHDELRKLQNRYEGVETEASVPDDVYVQADDLLRRLFSNLFNNGVEHNDSAIPRVSVTATTAAGTVTVHVADNGPGVPDDAHDGLFDPTINMSPDHGLGLNIVRTLAHRYDGRITLTETGATGSVFTVHLPRAKAE